MHSAVYVTHTKEHYKYPNLFPIRKLAIFSYIGWRPSATRSPMNLVVLPMTFQQHIFREFYLLHVAIPSDNIQIIYCRSAAIHRCFSGDKCIVPHHNFLPFSLYTPKDKETHLVILTKMLTNVVPMDHSSFC